MPKNVGNIFSPDFEGQKRVYTSIYRLFDLTLSDCLEPSHFWTETR
ncbi:hypothetical protein SHLO109777_10550 [Shewanella loihica]